MFCSRLFEVNELKTLRPTSSTTNINYRTTTFVPKRFHGQKCCIRFASLLAMATMTDVFWDPCTSMFNVLPPLRGTRMTLAARPRKYLCTEILGGILSKTAILTRHATKIIILKVQAAVMFIRHKNVINAAIASVFLTVTSLHYTPSLLCTTIGARSTAGSQLLDFTLHHAHLA